MEGSSLVVLLVVYLACINAGAYAAYAADKSRARNGEYRVSESALLLLGLAGGSIGAFAAQRILHHKTRKRSFQISFWMCVCLQIVLVFLAIELMQRQDAGDFQEYVHVSPSSSS